MSTAHTHCCRVSSGHQDTSCKPVSGAGGHHLVFHSPQGLRIAPSCSHRIWGVLENTAPWGILEGIILSKGQWGSTFKFLIKHRRISKKNHSKEMKWIKSREMCMALNFIIHPLLRNAGAVHDFTHGTQTLKPRQ